jgi:hypothetical protein
MFLRVNRFYPKEAASAFRIIKNNNAQIINEMASITVPVRDKKMIIWNFMEELWRKHQDSINDGRQPTFHLNEFRYFGAFEKYLHGVGIRESKTESIFIDTLVEYGRTGYYSIENNIVSLTKRGIVECRKPVHDWA